MDAVQLFIWFIWNQVFDCRVSRWSQIGMQQKQRHILKSSMSTWTPTWGIKKRPYSASSKTKLQILQSMFVLFHMFSFVEADWYNSRRISETSAEFFIASESFSAKCVTRKAKRNSKHKICWVGVFAVVLYCHDTLRQKWSMTYLISGSS